MGCNSLKVVHASTPWSTCGWHTRVVAYEVVVKFDLAHVPPLHTLHVGAFTHGDALVLTVYAVVVAVARLEHREAGAVAGERGEVALGLSR